MYFALVKGSSPEMGATVDCCECPNDLNYSTLHHCNHWSVWVYWDDDTKFKVANIVWLGGESYAFYNEFTEERCCIREHAHIVPMIRGALFYNNLFSRYASRRVAKTIMVYPAND